MFNYYKMFYVTCFITCLFTLTNANRILYIENRLNKSIILLISAYEDEWTLQPNDSVSVEVPEPLDFNVAGVYADCFDPKCYKPITFAEFQFGYNDMAFYEVSVKYGFNLPIEIEPVKKKSCQTIKCSDDDIIKTCPIENQVTENNTVIGCQASDELSKKCSVSGGCKVKTNYNIIFEFTEEECECKKHKIK